MKTFHRRVAAAIAASAALLALPPAHAGRPCDTRPQSTQDIARGMALAATTATRLDASGAQVVVLARAGQDLSRYGLAWSHFGFAYRERDGWRVVHKLNHCGSAHASLYRQGLAEFFLDQPHRHEAAFAVLGREAQSALLPLLRDNASVDRWHEPRYNMLAYPWSTRYQQSNQWAIETLAGAMDAQATDRERAQAWLRLRGYQPSTLRIDALTRLGGRITRANIAFDDHPHEKRFSDRIETVTADSVFAWLQRSGLGAAPAIVR
jgi:hypothetical protein